MTGLSMILLAQITNETSINYLLTSIILLGLGQGLVNMQVNNHALQSAPLNLISRVTPMSNELLQVVNSFAIAFITAFLQSQIQKATKNNSLTIAGNIAFHNIYLLLLVFVVIGFVITFLLKERRQSSDN